MEKESRARRNFVTNRLPWVTGFAALLVYVLTLNHWISFNNMAQVAKLSGFAWQIEPFNPVNYLVSAPLRLLPAHWVPFAVNLLAALLGAVVIGLLTRAVAILPHDRTHVQREREGSEFATLSVPLAWLPPVFAAMVCGLQLSFWQNATNGTADMVILLLFAYVVRALLEYRLDGEPVWLMKAAVAYGALMTSDWLAVGAFPAFLAALIWLRGMRFFNARFLIRTLICGLIGLSLYFLLPVVAAFTTAESGGFWETLKLNLGMEKTMVLMFPKKVLMLMFLTSAVPVLLLSVKWASYFGDTSQLGITLANSVFHVVHVMLLAVCLWGMFDPPFSPRHSGFGYSFLSLYFLSALSVGYFSGYLLLVFRPIRTRNRRTISGSQFLTVLASGVVMLLALASLGGLLLKNLPIVRENNRSPLVDYVRLTTGSLPKTGFLLADDPRRALIALQWLVRTGRDKDLVLVETWPLAAPAYLRHLKAYYGERWPFEVTDKAGKPVEPLQSVDVLRRLAKSGDLYYLHPSFGIYFEYFYPEPHGLVYRLQPYDADALRPPPLSSAVLAENEAFWQKAADEVFPALTKAIAVPEPGSKPTLRRRLLEALRLPDDAHGETRAANALFSRSLNYWAVEVQKTGDLEKAAKYFELAFQLNPDNVVARANLDFNRQYVAGERARVAMPTTVEDRFGAKYSSWDQVLGANGPFDEPNLSYSYGFTFMQKGLLRQAAAAFERVHVFAPDDLPTRLWLAQLNLVARHPERTLELTRDVNADPDRFVASGTNRVDALCLQARAHLAQQEPAQAVALLEGAVRAAPTNAYLLGNVTTVYSENGRFSNALANVERQLALNPEDTSSLLNKGFCHIQLNDFPAAIVTMTHLLSLETNNPNALLNRAIAYLRNDQLDLARQDYETLLAQYPKARQVYFGLAEIAYRRKETNTAIQQYTAYLSNAVPGNAETKVVEGRLRELRGESEPKP